MYLHVQWQNHSPIHAEAHLPMGIQWTVRQHQKNTAQVSLGYHSDASSKQLAGRAKQILGHGVEGGIGGLKRSQCTPYLRLQHNVMLKISRGPVKILRIAVSSYLGIHIYFWRLEANPRGLAQLPCPNPDQTTIHLLFALSKRAHWQQWQSISSQGKEYIVAEV